MAWSDEARAAALAARRANAKGRQADKAGARRLTALANRIRKSGAPLANWDARGISTVARHLAKGNTRGARLAMGRMDTSARDEAGMRLSSRTLGRLGFEKR